MLMVCGVDEAGRGPLAGPVYAAAVSLPERYDLPGLGDSKAISEKRREALFPEIQSQAAAYTIATASVEEIEQLNIREATRLAMRRAVETLPVTPDEVWIDGNMLIRSELPEKAFVKGDSLYPCISAASVLAKVARDRYMLELHQKYPQYGFDRHKGYGTQQHALALEEYGPCPEHRTGFVKTLLTHRNRGAKSALTTGEAGEQQAQTFLRDKGYRILCANYHSRFGEIDIIAEDGRFLVFAEVKTRKNNRFASGAEAVTLSKQRKIVKTALWYLMETPSLLQPRFDVIEVYGDSGEIHHIVNAFSG